MPNLSKSRFVSGAQCEKKLYFDIYQTDLIILGTRGLKGVERILQDSVSGQVVAEAPCSVLVVHPDQEQKRVG